MIVRLVCTTSLQHWRHLDLGTDMPLPPTLQLPRVKAHPGYKLLLETVESFVDILGPRQLANVFWAVRGTIASR